jgi:hypothetical protein
MGVFRFDEDGGDLHHPAAGELHEDDPIRADFLTQPSLPVGSLQCLYVAPLRVVFLFELIDGVLDPFPDIAREQRKLFLGIAGEFSTKAHVSRGARVSTLHV